MGNMWRIFAITLSIITVCSTQDPPATSIEADTNEVDVGGSFTVMCRVQNLNVPNFFRLEKYHADDEDTPVDLMTNSFLVESVKPMFRYSGAFSQEDGAFIFTFSVTDAKQEDSGSYKCVVFGEGTRLAESQMHNINVLVVPEDIELILVDPGKGDKAITDNEVLEFDEEVNRGIRCSIAGAYPKPDMHMMVGNVDISDRFELKENVISVESDEISLLRKVSYNVTMSVESTLLDNSFVRSGFRCVVDVGSQELSRGFQVKLPGVPPAFENCSSEITTYNGAPDVRIMCSVFASPPPMLKFTYHRQLASGEFEIITLMPGDEHSQYSFLEYEEGETVTAVIRIERIFLQMFRDHYLTAENEIGNNTHTIMLVRDESMEIPGGAASQVNTAITTVFLLPFVHFVLSV